MSEIDFVPKFRPREPPKFTDTAWLDFDEPQVILFQGMRGSGKGVSVESTAEKLYRAGINIWHIWSARSFENLFWMINLNCKEKYDRMKSIAKSFEMKSHQGNLYEKTISQGLIASRTEYDYYYQIMTDAQMLKYNTERKMIELLPAGIQLLKGQLLHCNCSKSYPVLWAVPDYIEFEQDTVDRFNGMFWENEKEYFKHSIEITTKDRILLNEGKLKKSKEFQPKEMLRIIHFTTPTTEKRKQIFREEFTKIVLEARNESRILIISPAIFEGSLDKFETVAEVFRMIPYLMNKSGHFMPLTEKDVGKEKKYWNKKQRSWHKVAIVVNELRSIVPSSQMHGEKSASTTKKAIFDFIPEARHYKTHFLGDYQSPQDLYKGVRAQSNMVIIKRGSVNILGEDWSWLFDKVKSDRFNLARKQGGRLKEMEKIEHLWFYERKLPKLKKFLSDRRPYVDSLPDNVGYVTYPNNEYKRESFEMPNFHHKQSSDDFLLVSGLRWKVNKNKKTEETATLTKKEKKESQKQKKVVKEEIFQKIDFWRKEGKSFTNIKEELVLMQNEGKIPDMGYSDKTSAYFSNRYNEWKKKQTVPET